MVTPTLFPRRYAFLIGVQAYRDAGIRDLKTPHQDVRLMAEALDAYGYQTFTCLDPDRAAFLAFLETAAAHATAAETQLVLYYAGHGVALTQAQTGGRETCGGYLLPADARPGALPESAVPMQVLADWVKKKLVCQQVLVVLDCCYAGAMRQAAGFRGALVDADEEVCQDDFRHFTRYRAARMLTSSAHNQRALDGYLNPDSGTDPVATSPFATLLARALQNREADKNRDGVVTLSELQGYVELRLAASAELLSHEQTSCLFPFSDHEGGEFVFLQPGRAARTAALQPLHRPRRVRTRGQRLFFRAGRGRSRVGAALWVRPDGAGSRMLFAFALCSLPQAPRKKN